MNERPDTEQIKAQLAADVVRLIGEQKLADAEACVRLGIAETDLARLRNGQGQQFSIDQLVGFLNAFDQQVQVKVGRPVGNPLRAIVDHMTILAAQIPPEELDKLPTDLAANLDHHLYGAPRRD